MESVWRLQWLVPVGTAASGVTTQPLRARSDEPPAGLLRWGGCGASVPDPARFLLDWGHGHAFVC